MERRKKKKKKCGTNKSELCLFYLLHGVNGIAS